MLKLNQIQVQFNHHPILNNFTAYIQPDDFIVIVGANGSGKTTLFDLIAGKIKATQGTIQLHSKDITNQTEFQRAHFASRLFQDPRANCVLSMTVAQNLSLASYKNRKASLASGLKTMAPELLDTLAQLIPIDIKLLLNKQMGSLSGGQRQIISFIMATMHKPELLLLDEPTAALDPAAATKLLVFANEYIKKNKITTLLITHDPYLALILGNKTWVLEQGHISRIYQADERKNLSPENLIGHINYAQIAKTN
jgi:putative ABC transport system ATP-binding protein